MELGRGLTKERGGGGRRKEKNAGDRNLLVFQQCLQLFCLYYIDILLIVFNPRRNVIFILYQLQAFVNAGQEIVQSTSFVYNGLDSLVG